MLTLKRKLQQRDMEQVVYDIQIYNRNIFLKNYIFFQKRNNNKGSSPLLGKVKGRL